MHPAPILVDSGFLVALGIRCDPRHAAAKAWLAGNTAPLLLTEPVITETCFFLSPTAKAALLRWVGQGRQWRPIDIPVAAHTEIAALIEKYADRDPDYTDAALIWAAQAANCPRILTVDRADFEIYRLKGGKRFQLIDWEGGGD